MKKILNLRKNLREAGVEYKVYKNTLVTLAAKELGLDGIVEYLEGPVSMHLVMKMLQLQQEY